MAGQESLGEAVLTLLVDSKTFESQIDAAKSYVKTQLGQIDVGAGSGGGLRPRGSGRDPRNSWAKFFRQAELVRADQAAQAEADAADLKKQADKDAADAQRARAKRQRDRQRIRQQRLSSGLIGGAFPLLFGQGPGAALGGAVGGAIGGGPLGFALSLVGTVVGQAADELVKKLSTLGTALKDPVANVSQLASSVSLSSASLAKYSQSLIAVGREAEAAALIEFDIRQSFGDTSDLTALSDAQDKLGRSTERLTISVGRLVAGPLADFLNIVNNIIKSGPEPGADGLPNFEEDVKRIEEQRRRSQAFQFGSLAFGLAGLPLALAGMSLDPGPPGAGLKEDLKALNEYKRRKELINKIESEQTKLAGSTTEQERIKLRLSILQLEAERDKILYAKDNLKLAKAQKDAKIEEAKIKAAEAKQEESDRAKALSLANREVSRIEKLNAAYGRLLNARIKLEAAPVFGETDTARVVMQAGASVASARVDEMMARRAVETAQRRLLNAQMFGTADDVSDAATDVRVAMMDAETAATNVKVALKEAANSILTNVQAAATRLRDATRSLRDLRLGSLRFLPAAQRQQLLREQIQRGVPEARRRGVALRGLGDILSFNRFIEQEQGARQTRADAERNMVDANNSLRNEMITQTGALTQLTTVMDRLIDKSWAVYVNVPSQNAASALNMANQLN